MNGTPASSKKNVFEVEYHTTTNFETRLTTGAYGGVTAQGLINVNFYIDRNAIPEKTAHEPDGQGLMQEVAKKGFEGVVREVHSGIIMDLNTAKNVVMWLQTHINHLEEALKPH